MARRNEQTRRLIALEAARLISDLGLRDYKQAKLRAAQRLGISGQASLPRNSEIELALREHQQLFEGDAHHQRLDRLRKVAIEALGFLAEFSPRLVGPVLEGTADRHSAVCLHVHCDSAETFTQFLLENGIPFDIQERTIRLDRERSDDFPACLFTAGDTAMDVLVLPLLVVRQPPISPVSGRPMNRADLKDLETLMAVENSNQTTASGAF
jgi:hypothetical protein